MITSSQIFVYELGAAKVITSVTNILQESHMTGDREKQTHFLSECIARIEIGGGCCCCLSPKGGIGTARPCLHSPNNVVSRRRIVW